MITGKKKYMASISNKNPIGELNNKTKWVRRAHGLVNVEVGLHAIKSARGRFIHPIKTCWAMYSAVAPINIDLTNGVGGSNRNAGNC